MQPRHSCWSASMCSAAVGYMLFVSAELHLPTSSRQELWVPQPSCSQQVLQCNKVLMHKYVSSDKHCAQAATAASDNLCRCCPCCLPAAAIIRRVLLVLLVGVGLGTALFFAGLETLFPKY